MANYLQMPKKQQVLALLELGWTYRRIEAETGVRRGPSAGTTARANQMRPKRSPARSVAADTAPREAARTTQMRPKRSPAPRQIRPKRSPVRRRRRGLPRPRIGRRSPKSLMPA